MKTINKILQTLAFTSLFLVVTIMVGSNVAATSTVLPVPNGAKVAFGIEADQYKLRRGVPVSIPFTIDTQGLEVDGVQLVATFQGATIKDAALDVSSELGLNVISKQIDSNGFSIMLLPEDPLVPLAVDQETQLFALKLTISETTDEDWFRISFDQENSLAPARENSANVLLTDGTKLFEVVDIEQEVVDEAVKQQLRNEQAQSQRVLLMVVGGMAVLLAIAGGGFLFWKKKATSLAVRPEGKGLPSSEPDPEEPPQVGNQPPSNIPSPPPGS